MRLRRWDFAGDGELPQLSRRRKQRGLKAMRDLRPLAEPVSGQSLTERTLEAAQDWSVQSTPRAEATCGLELLESRSRFFGHRTGLDVEAMGGQWGEPSSVPSRRCCFWQLTL